MNSAYQKSKIPIGTVVDGRFRITALIGRGGMGEVYKADEIAVGRTMAVKILNAPENSHALERFAREAHILSKLKHPNIVEFCGSGLHQGQFYIAMEFVEGRSLVDQLTHQRTLDIDGILQVAQQSLEALSYAHGFGIVHRDLKPSNIIVCDSTAAHNAIQSSQYAHLKLIDFGMSLLVELDASQRLTRTGATVGTVDYMSPEQCLSGHNIDHRTDIYALGATLYHCVAGRPPFSKVEDFAVMLAQMQETVPPLSMLPNTQKAIGLGAVIRKALEKNPANRYQTAAEMLVDVAAVNEGKSPQFASVKETSGSSTFQLPQKKGRSGKPRQILNYLWMAAVILGLVAAFSQAMRKESDHNSGTVQSAQQLYSNAETDIRTIASSTFNDMPTSIRRKVEGNLESYRSILQANERDHSLSREQLAELETALSCSEFITVHPQEGWQLFKRLFARSANSVFATSAHTDLVLEAMSSAVQYMEKHPDWRSDQQLHRTFDEIRLRGESLWSANSSMHALNEDTIWSTLILAARMDRLMHVSEGDLNRLLQSMKRYEGTESVDCGRAWAALGTCFIWNVKEPRESESYLKLAEKNYSVAPATNDDWRDLGGDYVNLAVQFPAASSRLLAAAEKCFQHADKLAAVETSMLLFAQYSIGEKSAAAATMHALAAQLKPSMSDQEAIAVKQMLGRYEERAKAEGDMASYAAAKVLADTLHRVKPTITLNRVKPTIARPAIGR